MTPAEFLRLVWPEDGLYCIAVPLQKGYSHLVCNTVEDAAARIDALKDAKDIFFCVHSLKEKKIWNPNKGDGGGWSVRTQSNMQEARAFFFDLDVGEGDKKYASQKDALIALKQFILDTKLPYPMLVSSGGGLHVYWLLETSIVSTEWRTYAARLKQLADAHGLKADPARTTDTASVLRVAGTFNHKRGEKRPVRVLKSGAVTTTEDFISRLNDAIICAGVKPVEHKAPVSVDPYFGEGNIDRPSEPISIKAAARVCAQVRYFLQHRGNISEPKWHVSLNIARFCIKGDELVHWISNQHPEYDRDKTDAKVQRLKDYRDPETGKPMGPSTCARIAAVCGEDRCRDCQFFGKGSSPIVHARRSLEAPAPIIQVQAGPTVVEVEIPNPPKPYKRTADGKIQVEAINKEGEKFQHTIYDRDLYPVRRVRNEMLNIEQLIWRVSHPKDGLVEFVLDADALYDRKKFFVVVANVGVYVRPDDMKELQNYMIAYVAELQRLAAADAQANHLGWTDDKTAFILPDKIVCNDGDVKPVTLSATAATHAAPLVKKGSLERQLELLNFYNHPAYLPNQFAILAGLAAPLIGMTGHHGVIINCTGEAGASKSSSVYTAAAMWGNPERFTINGTKDGSTMRHRNSKTDTLANLPICVDEITNLGLDEAHNMAMGVSQSEGRGRLKPDGTPQKAPEGEKATIVITTSNNSLHGLLSTNNSASTAASMRVFEINFGRQLVHKKWEADDFLRDLKQNFGHIGEIFIQHVTKNYAAVETMVREEMKRVDQEANIQSGERFWSGVVAVIIVAGRIASQLGLLQYDVAALRAWVLTVQIPAMRGVVHDEYSSPIGILTDYLEMISGNTIVVQKIKSNGIVNILKKPSNQLLAHHDYEDRTMWVLRKGFKDYCTKIGANFLKVIDDLHAAQTDAENQRLRVITNKNVKKVMGAGTEFGKAQAWCFVIDLKHPDCLGIPDLELVTNPAAAITPPKGELKLIDES